MKRLLTILVTATFFAISCSLIDQLVWNNDFHWLNAVIGFAVGGILVLLSKTPVRERHTKISLI